MFFYKIVVYFGTNFARLSDVFGTFTNKLLSIDHDVGQSRTENFLRRCCFDQQLWCGRYATTGAQCDSETDRIKASELVEKEDNGASSG
jgi:hypothetical protein